MRWFKNYTDNHRGQIVQTLLNEHGHAGVCAYYFIMELCSEKIESLDQKDDFVFVFKRPYFDNILRMKRKHSDLILVSLSQLGILNSETNYNEVRIKMPILSKLLDKRNLKMHKSGISNALTMPLEIDIEIEIDKELDKDIILDRAAKSETPETKEIAIKRQNRSVSKQAPVQLKTMQDFYNCVGPEICESWFNIYKSKEFIEKEVLKSFSWLLANPNKATRSPRGWKQFYTNWFSKAIDSQAKTGLSNKPSKLDIDNINLTEVKR